MKQIFFLATVLLALVVTYFFVPTTRGAFLDMSQKSLDNRNIAADFALKDMDGKLIQLSKLKGKIVVINFWATWCGPCIEEIPMLNSIKDEYQGKGVQVIGASVDKEGFVAVRNFIQAQGIKPNYPIIVANHLMLEGYREPAYLPTTFVIDKEGIIRKETVGAVSKERLQNVLDNLLSERN